MAASHDKRPEQNSQLSAASATAQSPEVSHGQSVTGPVVGAIFALCAFSVAIVAGMFSGNSATSVLGRALLAMIVCYPCGLLVGYICHRVIHDHLRSHAEANPVPDLLEHGVGTEGEEDAAHGSANEEEPIVV